MTPDRAYAFVIHSIAEGRLAQAFIVAAPPRGAGETFAKRVLSRLLCRETEPPCGVCKRCIGVERGIHPDVHRLEPQMKSRVIGMEPMRDFLRQINITSFEGGWKSGVIISADCLNPSAANAFLKTLEEPPKQTLFFLLTDSPQRLLPTIISRCQRLSIEDSAGVGASEEDCRDLVTILSGTEVSDGVSGAFGRADQLTAFMKERRVVIEKKEKLDSKADSDEDVEKDTLEARIGAQYREWRHGVLCAMLSWYRDVLLLVCRGDEKYICFKDDLPVLREAAAGCSYRRAMEQIRAMETVAVQLNRNLSEALVFENLFFKLIG